MRLHQAAPSPLWDLGQYWWQPPDTGGSRPIDTECGIDPIGSTRDPVPVKFFLIAISFILFDIEVIFLLPWAVVARDLGMFGFVSILIFVTLVMIGYFYELGRGALKWD